jgi:tetrathionate reductase subunit B
MPESMPFNPPPWERAGQERGAAMKRAGILVDLRRCVGCHACAVSCKTENDVPLGGFRIRTHYLERPDRPTHIHLPMMCQHCQDAPCIPACPNEAIVRLPDGRVEISKSDCQTAGMCIKSCPYDAIHIDPQAQKADKCNLCTQRTDVGLLPACVESCPTEALRFGDFDDAESAVSAIARREGAKPLHPEAGTRPTVQYIGLTPWMDEAVPGIQLHAGEKGIIYEK